MEGLISRDTIRAVLARLWLLISLTWAGICLWGFNDSGEIHHMTIETYAMMFAPFLIRLAVLFVLFGIPRATVPRRFPR